MKRNFFSIFVLVAVIGLALAGCPNDGDDGKKPQTETPQTVAYVSTDSGGNLYTLEITEKLQGRSARYTAKQGDTFKLTVELFNNGNYTVALTYSGTIDSTVNNGTEIGLIITVNGEVLNITIVGTEMTVINGTIKNEGGEAVVETPENLTPVVNKTALGAAINVANAAKEGVVVSVNGTEVLTTVYWVTQTQMETFTTAIAYAQAFFDSEEADQSMANSEKIKLAAATNIFNGQKKLGTKTDTQNQTYDVYVVGTISTGMSEVAMFWKNGVSQTLDLSGATDCSDANSVFVSESGNVYVAGGFGSIPGISEKATLWKDGVLQNLSFTNGIKSATNSVSVSKNGDVYVAGYEYDPLTARLWRNGTIQNLGTSGSSSARSVHVSANGDVYVVGMDNNAKLWKNGVAQTINFESGGTFTLLNSVFVSNNGDVYVVGRVTTPVIGSEYSAENPTLWKNGIAQTLYNSLPNTGSEANSVFVSDVGDVFVAGFVSTGEKWVATLWKNGVIQSLELSIGNTGSVANSVFVAANGDVYVTGRVDSWNGGANDNSVATLWKNGVVQTLDLSGGNFSNAKSVFVKAR
jgi:predicted heme/steroid binding protein